MCFLSSAITYDIKLQFANRGKCLESTSSLGGGWEQVLLSSTLGAGSGLSVHLRQGLPSPLPNGNRLSSSPASSPGAGEEGRFFRLPSPSIFPQALVGEEAPMATSTWHKHCWGFKLIVELRCMWKGKYLGLGRLVYETEMHKIRPGRRDCGQWRHYLKGWYVGLERGADLGAVQTQGTLCGSKSKL